MKKTIEFLDDKALFAVAILGVLSLVSLPITYGGPLFQLSTYGVVISIVSLFAWAVFRLLAGMLQSLYRKALNK